MFSFNLDNLKNVDGLREHFSQAMVKAPIVGSVYTRFIGAPCVSGVKVWHAVKGFFSGCFEASAKVVCEVGSFPVNLIGRVVFGKKSLLKNHYSFGNGINRIAQSILNGLKIPKIFSIILFCPKRINLKTSLEIDKTSSQQPLSVGSKPVTVTVSTTPIDASLATPGPTVTPLILNNPAILEPKTEKEEEVKNNSQMGTASSIPAAPAIGNLPRLSPLNVTAMKAATTFVEEINRKKENLGKIEEPPKVSQLDPMMEKVEEKIVKANKLKEVVSVNYYDLPQEQLEELLSKCLDALKYSEEDIKHTDMEAWYSELQCFSEEEGVDLMTGTFCSAVKEIKNYQDLRKFLENRIEKITNFIAELKIAEAEAVPASNFHDCEPIDKTSDDETTSSAEKRAQPFVYYDVDDTQNSNEGSFDYDAYSFGTPQDPENNIITGPTLSVSERRQLFAQ